jgi:hypothetical protein
MPTSMSQGFNSSRGIHEVNSANNMIMGGNGVLTHG